MNNTSELTKLLDVACHTVAGGEQVRGLLQAVRDKLLLLDAAQSAARDGASHELLVQILDETN